MKGLSQNTEKKYAIPKSNKYIRKKLKEISARPHFSSKRFLYNKYFNKIWSCS